MKSKWLIPALEIGCVLILALTPATHPQVGALLLVLGRWAVFFSARATRQDVFASLAQAAVPLFGWVWVSTCRAAQARVQREVLMESFQEGIIEENRDTGGFLAQNRVEEIESEVDVKELLQLNVELMSRTLAQELGEAGKSSRRVAPLVDVAGGSDYRNKQLIVIRLRELKTLNAVEALKALRRQSDPDLQYLSATALASLEQSENARVLAGEQRVLEMPRDHEARIELSKTRVFLCRTGLLAASGVSSQLQKAQVSLREVLEDAHSKDQDNRARECLSEVCELMGDFEQAATLLASCTRPSREGLERWASCVSALGNESELTRACERILAELPSTDPLFEAASVRMEQAQEGTS